MGDIEAGVSHFLYPNHPTWLPTQRYDVTLKEKHDLRMQTATRWREGLLDGTYQTRADIARANNISRTRVTRLMNEFEKMAHA